MGLCNQCVGSNFNSNLLRGKLSVFLLKPWDVLENMYVLHVSADNSLLMCYKILMFSILQGPDLSSKLLNLDKMQWCGVHTVKSKIKDKRLR